MDESKREGAILQWHVSLRVRGVQILEDVSGNTDPGSFTAVIGGSGSGKSSLLACLSHSCRSYSGHVLLNGQQLSSRQVKQIGFVRQEDIFIPTLTVREHLNFAAAMSLKAGRDEWPARVEQLLRQLGLTKCAATIIGGQDSLYRGISGGERKRLSLATAMMGSPSCILADEPTSGLDSYRAETVVATLRSLAESGCTVVVSIHQPSSAVFEYFTHCSLLANGQSVFHGTLQHAAQHFTALGFPCPAFHNPADHYIRLLSGVRFDPTVSAERSLLAADSFEVDPDLVTALIAAYDGDPAVSGVAPSGLSTATLVLSADEKDSSAEGGSQCSSHAAIVSDADLKRLNDAQQSDHNLYYYTGWGCQFKHIFWRSVRMYSREPMLTIIRAIHSTVVACLIGLIYFHLSRRQVDVQSINGLLYYVLTDQAVMGTFGVILTLPLELPVFLREHSSGLYRVDTYFLGRTMAELPFQILFPFVYSTIVFYLVGLSVSTGTFWTFAVFVTVLSNTAISLGYFLSALANSVMVAIGLGLLVLMPLIVLGAMLINVSQIPAYFLWLSSFSFLQYAYKGISIAVWNDLGTLECPALPLECPYQSGQAVLKWLNFDTSEKWPSLVYLAILCIGFRLSALGVMSIKAKRNMAGGY